MKKSGHNKFAGYYYFELGDFLQPIQTIFSELGLCGVVSFEHDLATLKIIDIDSPDQFITFTSPMGSAALKGCHEVQNIGAVETYQRRYLYVVALEIVEHDALEAVTGKANSMADKKEAPKSVSKDEFDKLTSSEQENLRSIAMIAISFISKGEVGEAISYIEGCELDDLKAPLWSLFDSKQRAAMKAHTQPRG
jgi:hypothetical protein